MFKKAKYFSKVGKHVENGWESLQRPRNSTAIVIVAMYIHTICIYRLCIGTLLTSVYCIYLTSSCYEHVRAAAGEAVKE